MINYPKTISVNVGNNTQFTTCLPDEFYPFENSEENSHVPGLTQYLKEKFDIECEYYGVQDGTIYFKQCSKK